VLPAEYRCAVAHGYCPVVANSKNYCMVFHMSRAARVRVLPFLAFMLLLALHGALPTEGASGIDPRWIYGLTVLVVGGMLIGWHTEYGELARQNLPDARQSLWAAAVGMLVFVLWIHLDAPWMTLGEAAASFHPVTADGELDWPLVVARWIGATLMVPVMEELFWRSFLMRWIQRPDFVAVAPGQVGLLAVVVATFLFVLVHPLWLAATLAGLAYAWLYIRTGKLWSCVIAHAVTNGALGLWVVYTRQWQFW
jgi:CAAX prenyl protease-like protein